MLRHPGAQRKLVQLEQTQKPGPWLVLSPLCSLVEWGGAGTSQQRGAGVTLLGRQRWRG